MVIARADSELPSGLADAHYRYDSRRPAIVVVLQFAVVGGVVILAFAASLLFAVTVGGISGGGILMLQAI